MEVLQGGESPPQAERNDMQDHRAPARNTFQSGVPAGEAFNQAPLEGGVSANQGVPRESEEYIAAHTQLSGISMPGPGMAPDRIVDGKPHCLATTKKGNPCKAYSVTDDVFCQGHQGFTE